MSGWRRRTFLKAGALGTAGMLVHRKGHAEREPFQKPWNAATGRSLRKYRDPAPTICRMCPAHCGIVALRDGDRVVQIQGNTGAPTNQGGLCARAYAGLERLYDPERQLAPLRRRGERGGGEWVAVSWDEALGEIEERLHREGRSVLHLGQEEMLVQELRPFFGWEAVLVDRLLPGRPGPGSGESWYGAPAIGPDLSRARTVFLFGSPAVDGRFPVPQARGLAAARSDGAQVHVFDSVGGINGGWGIWHPVAPGAEATVAWGMARMILELGRHDAGAFQDGIGDSPEDLKTALEAYHPQAVERATGVPALQLLTLTRRFLEEAPAVALASPDSAAAPAAALLNHLAGSLNRRGGLATARGPYFAEPLQPTGSPEAWLQALVEGGATAEFYWAVDANPAYHAPRSPQVAAALADPGRVGFLVVSDTHLTETAQLADLFLPLATSFESWGLIEGALPDGRTYIFLQQPVTRPASEPDKLRAPDAAHPTLFRPAARPLGSARGLPDVLLDLLARREPNPFPFRDSHGYLTELLRKSWGPGSLAALERRGIWVAEEATGPSPRRPVSFVGAASRKAPENRPAPQGISLVGFASAVLPHSYANTRWGREIEHRSSAFLHPSTAHRLGVRTGEEIIVAGPAGEARTRVQVLQGIHPQAVALPDGFGHWAGGQAAQALPTPPQPQVVSGPVTRKEFLARAARPAGDAARPRDPIWWAHSGPGVSLRALFPFRVGEEGLQDWGALEVSVRKA